MQKIVLKSLLFSLILMASSCSKNEINLSKVIDSSELVIQSTKYSSDLETEFKVYNRLLDLAKIEKPSENARGVATQNYYKYLERNGIKMNFSNAKIATTDAYNIFIAEFQNELSNVPENENMKETGRTVITKYLNKLTTSNLSIEEKQAVTLVFNKYDEIFNIAVTNLPNGRIEYCWRRFFCQTGVILVNTIFSTVIGTAAGLAGGSAGMLIGGSAGLIVGVIAGVNEASGTTTCRSCG